MAQYSKHECQNCGAVVNGEELEPICDLWQRILPGERVPSGQCPHCQCLTHKYDQQERYVRHNGQRCPYCESKNIMAHPVSSDNFDNHGEGNAWLEVECHDCGKLWIDQYELVGFKEPE